MSEHNSSPSSNQGNKPYEPVIKAYQLIPEMTLKTLVLGTIISIVFGVAMAYVGLKFGMTISASIPAAVISMAVLRTLFRRQGVTVLENNIVQTVASAGASLASGIVFTIPAFFIWAMDKDMQALGYTLQITRTQIFWLAIIGGTMGILMMVPLRKYLVEKEHGVLKYPEGTACAEIIVAGDEGGTRGRTVFTGLGIGALYNVFQGVSRLWTTEPTYDFKGFLKGGNIGMSATPILLAVGYIIGPQISALMMAGAVVGYLGIGPLIGYLGTLHPDLILAPGSKAISLMDSGEIRKYYICYFGVGAVALGGIMSLIKSIPTIVHSFAAGFAQLFGRKGRSGQETLRTDRDLPMWIILGGLLAVIVATRLLPGISLTILSIFLAVVFGFFFVVVAARIVGIVGSSSSPVSGMTIFTLLITCLILLSFGISGVRGMVSAMTVGVVVCIAVCLSGDISQDLKTGYLLGATPIKQQVGGFIGLFFPALVMGLTVFLLADSYGFDRTVNPDALLAPQATIMATVVKGVIGQNIPWALIMGGAFIALGVELLGIGSLPFAIGLYLPMSLSTPIMVGGIVALLITKFSKDQSLAGTRQEKGILLGSGLIAGDALVGVLTAGLVAFIPVYKDFYMTHEATSFLTGSYGPFVSLVMFLILAIIFYAMVMAKNKKL